MRLQKGFTLLEIILATTLVVFGVVAIVAAISSGVAGDNSIDGKVVALRLAQEAIENVEDASNLDYSNLNATYATSAAPVNEDGGAFNATYNREVDVINVETGLTQVTAKVNWNLKSNPMAVSLTTLLASDIPPAESGS